MCLSPSLCRKPLFIIPEYKDKYLSSFKHFKIYSSYAVGSNVEPASDSPRLISRIYFPHLSAFTKILFFFFLQLEVGWAKNPNLE